MISAWLSSINSATLDREISEEEGEPIVLGEKITIDNEGLFRLFVRTTDAVCNSMIISTINSVNSDLEEGREYKLPMEITHIND